MQNALHQADRRISARTPCNLFADLDDYENSYSAQIRNLGNGGAFIQKMMNNEAEIGSEVIMTIPFKASTDYLIIKARIAWISQDGMGVTFLKSPREDGLT